MRIASTIAALIILSGSSARALAQATEAAPSELAITPGALIERVTARAAPAQSYALYVPSSYTPERRWPVLFLLDPRGRALVPLALFKDAAERLGYLVLSSYNTASDGPAEPNVQAVDAMLEEVQDNFALDDRRIYLAGFSGTARVSWQFAVQLRDNVAGVIGIGAGLPTPLILAELARLGPSPFVFFGASGLTDFNYEEVRALDEVLDALPVRHHVEYFAGTHEWPPVAVASRALEWMELQAMRAGLRPRDARLIDSLHGAWIAAARGLEESSPEEAWSSYARVRDDFSELRDVSAETRKTNQLARHRAVRRVIAMEKTLTSRDSAYQEKLLRYLSQVRSSREPPPVGTIDRELDLQDLKREAARADEPMRALAAQRMLERAFVFLAFYEPRAYFDSDQQARAIALLGAARRIKPDSPQVCFSLARAHTELGENSPALEALECAVRSSAMGAAQLEREPTLAGLRSEPGFRAIVERLRASGRP